METNEFDSLMKSALAQSGHEEFTLPPSFSHRVMQQVEQHSAARRKRTAWLNYLLVGTIVLMGMALVGYVLWQYMAGVDLSKLFPVIHLARYFEMYSFMLPMLCVALPVVLLLIFLNGLLQKYTRRMASRNNVAL